MKTHYTEADLLDTYYMQPGASMPVMMHLAGCSECAARYERLDRKIREAAACHTPKEEAFWAAQRSAVMSKISGRRLRRPVAAVLRVAAAVLLAVVIVGVVAERRDTTPSAQMIEQLEERVPADPWQSEELREFGEFVQWESWMAEPSTTKGDQSL